MLSSWAAPRRRLIFNEGAAYLAVRPLIGRHRERPAALRLHQTEQYLMMSLYQLREAGAQSHRP